MISGIYSPFRADFPQIALMALEQVKLNTLMVITLK